MEILMPVKSLK